MFTKQGEENFIGSKYECKIVPVTKADYKNINPVFTKRNGIGVTTGYFNFPREDREDLFGIGSDTFEKPFRAEIYRNGKFYMDDSSLNGKWGLVNKNCHLEMRDSRLGEIRYNRAVTSDLCADIITYSVTVDNYSLFAVMPITVVSANLGYTYEIAPDSGFRAVTYTKQGTLPTFEGSTVFKLVTNEPMSETSSINWRTEGNLTSPAGNPPAIYPRPIYNGYGNTHLVICETENATIYNPIYMSLAFDELRAVNEYHGTSYSNSELSLIQAGAGHIDSNNNFTGVIIGTSQKDGSGLLAYNNGVNILAFTEEGKCDITSNNVKITGGSISNINLSSSNVDITGGTINNTTITLNDKKTYINNSSVTLEGYIKSKASAAYSESLKLDGEVRQYSNATLINYLLEEETKTKEVITDIILNDDGTVAEIKKETIKYIETATLDDSDRREIYVLV